MITKQKMIDAIGAEKVNTLINKQIGLGPSSNIFFVGGDLPPYTEKRIGHDINGLICVPSHVDGMHWDIIAIPHTVIEVFVPAEQSRQYPWFEPPCFASRSYVGGEADDWTPAFKIWSKELCKIVDALEKPSYEVICKENADWFITRTCPCMYACAIEVQNKNDNSAAGTRIVVIASRVIPASFITELGSYHTVVESSEDGKMQKTELSTTIAKFYPGECGWELAKLCAKLRELY